MNLSSVQDWLIVVGALLIAGVLLDAYRRYRNESRNPIRMGRKLGFWNVGGGFREDAEPASTELPNGGARVRERRGGVRDEAPSLPDSGRVEPTLEGGGTVSGSGQEGAGILASEPRAARPPQESPLPESVQVPVQAGGDDAAEVLVIHVLAHAAEGFSGEALARVFQACDVRFGAMSIFHRHEEEKGMGAVQFSVVNLTHPGGFPDAALEGFNSPGLSFILRLPGPQRPLEAFDCMLETARAVARNLDGELQDESHSVFTSQTAEHCRERIRGFAHRSIRPRRPS